MREKGIGIIWLKIQPSLDEWVLKPTSCEAMKMKLFNHKPVNRSKGTFRTERRSVKLKE
ncbi:hypothetical protein [Sulfolobus sp. B1]|uniref:hypothetical protein n=1 Tax=Sulfolobus sp. B1 TaxID=2200888 RepID=UPI00210234C5|nr:hypothetical protein [Sulfolobus sp. B1]